MIAMKIEKKEREERGIESGEREGEEFKIPWFIKLRGKLLTL